MSDAEICFSTATELAARLRRRDVSSRELVEVCLRQIERHNPAVNAFVTLQPEAALAGADAADARLAAGTPRGPLEGLPIGVKDLFDTAGLRTTYASPMRNYARYFWEGTRVTRVLGWRGGGDPFARKSRMCPAGMRPDSPG